MESVEKKSRLSARLERVFEATKAVGRIAVESILHSTTIARTAVASVIAPELAREAELAYLDPNTSMPNKRAMERRFTELITSGEPFAAIMLDLDGFKLVNEQIGHAYADTILAQFGEGLQGLIRETDSLYFQGSAFRTGGDEFVILAPLNSRTKTTYTDEARLGALLARIDTEYTSGSVFTDPTGANITLSATAYGAVANPSELSPENILPFMNDISVELLNIKRSRTAR